VEEAGTREQRQAAWDAYWANGTLNSLPGSFSGNYGGALHEFWMAVFRNLPPHGRVLDIATGNGALPKMLLESHVARPFHIDAIDVADVAPSWLADVDTAQRQQLHFHARTPAERLPFADDAFDLCISQYGVEYSDLGASVPEALRVTRRDGLIAWVLHHPQSHPVRLAREDQQHCAWLLSPDGPFASAFDVLGSAARAGSAAGRLSLQQDPTAEQQRQRFNAAMQRLSMRAASTQVPDTLHRGARAIMQILQQAQRLGEAAAHARLRDIHQAIEHGLRRNDDLLMHIPTTTAIEMIRTTLLGARPNWGFDLREIVLDIGLAGQALISGPPESIAQLRK
jgi:ubiquinone/menaquinone biosynthesis C-methylase UbiE